MNKIELELNDEEDKFLARWAKAGGKEINDIIRQIIRNVMLSNIHVTSGNYTAYQHTPITTTTATVNWLPSKEV